MAWSITAERLAVSFGAAPGVDDSELLCVYLTECDGLTHNIRAGVTSCLCVYVYIYVCMYVCMYIYIYIYIYMYI